jgi:hypothetical protein
LYPFQKDLFPSLFLLHSQTQALLISNDVLASRSACFSMLRVPWAVFPAFSIFSMGFGTGAKDYICIFFQYRFIEI